MCFQAHRSLHLESTRWLCWVASGSHQQLFLLLINTKPYKHGITSVFREHEECQPRRTHCGVDTCLRAPGLSRSPHPLACATRFENSSYLVLASLGAVACVCQSSLCSMHVHREAPCTYIERPGHLLDPEYCLSHSSFEIRAMPHCSLPPRALRLGPIIICSVYLSERRCAALFPIRAPRLPPRISR